MPGSFNKTDSSLPAGLGHARNLAFRSHFAQRDAGEAEFPVDGVRTAGYGASVHDAVGVGVERKLAQLADGGHAVFGGSRRALDGCFEFSAEIAVFRRALDALFVLCDFALFGHISIVPFVERPVDKT